MSAAMEGGVVQAQAAGGGSVDGPASHLNSQLELSPEDPGKRGCGGAAVADDGPVVNPEGGRKQGLLGLFRKYEQQSCGFMHL